MNVELGMRRGTLPSFDGFEPPDGDRGEPVPAPGTDLRATLGVLRRQARLIAATVALVLVVALIVIASLRPAYTATALVLIDPSHKDLLDPVVLPSTSASESARVDSEVEVVKTEASLLAVVASENLAADPEFAEPVSALDRLAMLLRLKPEATAPAATPVRQVVARLRDAISVQRRALTYLIAISARASQPATAARLANAVANAYIQEQLRAKIAGTLASRDIIQSRIAVAGDAVAASEAAFDTFIADTVQQITAATGRADLSRLRDELAAATAARSDLADTLLAADADLRRRDWAAVAGALQATSLTDIIEQRQDLAAGLATTADGSETATNLRSQLAAIEGQLGSAAEAELSSLRAELAAADANIADLRAKLRSAVLGSELPTAVLTAAYQLQQTAELARGQYQTLLSRLNELEAQAYLQVADSRVVSAAAPPDAPSFPNVRVLLALAAMAALALAVGLAFLRDNFIGGFTSTGQLRSVLATPVVAAMPRLRGGRRPADGSDQTSLADTVVEAPLSLFSESVRRIRLGVDQALRRLPGFDPARGLVVMVTSANPREGKTTAALALTRAYALSGRSALLIDCDLRKPSVHQQLALEPSAGLLDYLSLPEGSVALTRILAADTLTDAQIALGSRRSDRATDQLITGKAFTRLVAAARESFDVVILDTPPVGPVVDGLYLAQSADVVVFLTRWASTSQQDARLGVAALASSMRPDVEILAVLTQQEDARASYRSRHRGYYAEP